MGCDTTFALWLSLGKGLDLNFGNLKLVTSNLFGNVEYRERNMEGTADTYFGYILQAKDGFLP